MQQHKKVFRIVFLAPCLSIFVLQGCALLAAGSGAAVVHSRREAATLLEDQSIEMSARKILGGKFEPGSNRIVPVAYNGHLLLVGQTTDDNVQESVVAELRQIRGIKRIWNKLSVKPILSFSQQTRDAAITAKIKGEFLKDRRIDMSQIKVVTEDKVVYLLGLVHPSEEQAAIEGARKFKEVLRVVTIFDVI